MTSWLQESDKKPPLTCRDGRSLILKENIRNCVAHTNTPSLDYFLRHHSPRTGGVTFSHITERTRLVGFAEPITFACPTFLPPS